MINIYNVNYKKIFINILASAAALLALYLLFRLALYLLPFVIAFTVSTLMEPAIRFFMQRLGMSRKISVALTMFLIFSVFGTLFTLLALRVICEVKSFSLMLPYYFTGLYDSLNSFLNRGAQIYVGLPSEISASIDAIISNISLSLMNLVNSVLQGIMNTAVSIPQTLVFITVTILSTYFIAGDRDKIYGFFNGLLPASLLKIITGIKNDVFDALFGYLKAELILMSITFGILSLGFWVVGIRYALLTALFISLIDALPVLGTGSVLVPWAVYNFLQGKVRLGLYILAVYVIVLIVRQVIEPKILGKQIGIHPLATLLAMYGGLQLFGLIGMFLGPILALLAKNIIQGVMRRK